MTKMLQQLRLNSLHLRESCQDTAGQEGDWTDVTVTVALKPILQHMLHHAVLVCAHVAVQQQHGRACADMH